MKKIFIVLLILSGIFFTNCTDKTVDPVEVPDERGVIVEVKSDVILTKLVIQVMVSQFADNATPDFLPEYDVEVVSLVYKTIDYDGNFVQASGVVIFPKLKDSLFPLVGLYHGTQTNRNRVGSVSYTNAFDGIIAASLGYVVAEPDYLGLGYSNMFHPYHDEKTSASCAIDMLRAARNYCEENNIHLNDKLFLTGYSQGGYVTMATHKEIELNYSNEFKVTASAPMAGALDLYGTAMYLIQNEDYSRPSFISYLALAYNKTYKWNKLNEIFKAPYNTLVEGLFDGSKNTWEIDQELPAELSILFTQSFLNGIPDGQNNYMGKALLNNGVLDWSPVAPITIIHGDADTFVPVQNAINAKASLLNNGARDVQLVLIEGGDHETSVLPAIEYTINWFNSISKASLPKVRLTK